MTKLYLVSPENFDINEFDSKLQNILRETHISIFQLRLKNKTDQEVRFYAKKLLQTCDKYNCALIVNDYVDIAIEIGASGVHVGQDDQNIRNIRKKVNKDFIIGASCYDSRDLALNAAIDGASHVSFGAFFPSKTKNSRGKADVSLIKWANKSLDIPVVAIGGIDPDNCEALAKENVDFISVISYIWDHPKGEIYAIKEFQNRLGQARNL